MKKKGLFYSKIMCVSGVEIFGVTLFDCKTELIARAVMHAGDRAQDVLGNVFI